MKKHKNSTFKLCWVHKTGENSGLYIVARNKGRAARLFCNATGERDFYKIEVEKIPFDFSDDYCFEGVLWPGSDLALMYGVEYAKG